MNNKFYYFLLFASGLSIGIGSTILVTNANGPNNINEFNDEMEESYDEHETNLSVDDSPTKIYKSIRKSRPYRDYTSCFPTADEASKWVEGRAKADFEEHMAEREYPEDEDEEDSEQDEIETEEMTSIDRHSEMEINSFDLDRGKISDTGPDTFTIHAEDAGEVYALAELVYTVVDGYLTDAEDHSVYDDPARIIGEVSIEDCDDSYFVDGDDKTHVFIRNTRLKTDFDILIFVGSRDDYLDSLDPTLN